jgi:outer membrane protein TolC
MLMVGAGFRLLSWLCFFRRLTSRLGAAGLPLATLGCMMPMSSLDDQGPAINPPRPVAVRPASHAVPHVSGIATVAFRINGPQLPPPTAVLPAEIPPPLEAVMRMADAKNAQIARARVTVEESETAEAVAEHSHLPDCLRQEPFRRRSAEAHVWEHKVELAKVRSEVLQDAGTTYIDWLTARRSEAIMLELEDYEQKLLKRARALARDEKSAQSLVETLEMTLAGRKQGLARLRQQAEAAAAKLADLLNSGDHLPVAGDAALVPVDLTDAGLPAEALVQQSLTNGPGVREMAGLQAAIEKVVAEARFLQCGCNRTGCIGFCGRLKVAQDKVEEVRLGREDQAGKLRLGVIEARSAILSGREQIVLGTDQVRHAAEAYRLSNVRLDDMLSAATLGDVQGSIRGLEAAHFAYLQAVAAYDKAEVRLLILLGWLNGCPHPAP